MAAYLALLLKRVWLKGLSALVIGALVICSTVVTLIPLAQNFGGLSAAFDTDHRQEVLTQTIKQIASTKALSSYQTYELSAVADSLDEEFDARDSTDHRDGDQVNVENSALSESERASLTDQEQHVLTSKAQGFLDLYKQAGQSGDMKLFTQAQYEEYSFIKNLADTLKTNPSELDPFELSTYGVTEFNPDTFEHDFEQIQAVFTSGNSHYANSLFYPGLLSLISGNIFTATPYIFLALCALINIFVGCSDPYTSSNLTQLVSPLSNRQLLSGKVLIGTAASFVACAVVLLPSFICSTILNGIGDLSYPLCWSNFLSTGGGTIVLPLGFSSVLTAILLLIILVFISTLTQFLITCGGKLCAALIMGVYTLIGYFSGSVFFETIQPHLVALPLSGLSPESYVLGSAHNFLGSGIMTILYLVILTLLLGLLSLAAMRYLPLVWSRS